MVTENVTISFVENGARVIKRKIDDIGQAANHATRGIFLLKRALFVLGGAGLLRGLQKYVDLLTNLENKLRLTTTSTANLEAVQDQLFAAANRARSSIEAAGDIYTRVALSARQLGVSQQAVIAVTETLQKAAILSGAGAQEAHAALIQLGQGLASNRLSGDELRSVLEQLPYVADLIVNYLNQTQQFGQVTRGTLRQLGKEGKLTSDIVFNAIAASQQSVNALFAQTNPTIEQAFNVARNNILKFIDDFDDATGASAALANAIIAISENLNIILGVLGLVAGGFALSFGASVLARIKLYMTNITRIGVGVAQLADIQVISAKKQVIATSAVLNDNRARLANIAMRRTQITATLENAKAEYAEATAVFQGGSARSAATGQFISMTAARDRLTAATIRLTAAEHANNIATGRTVALSAEVALAQNAHAASITRLNTATVVQGGLMARLSRTFPLLSGSVRILVGLISRFFGLLFSNPITGFIALLVSLIAAVFLFGDKIQIAGSKILTLKDIMVAAFQIMGEKISGIVGIIHQFFTPAINSMINATIYLKDKIVEVWNFIVDTLIKVAETIANIINSIIGFFVGLVNGTIRAFGILPDAIIDIFNILRNGVLTVIENMVNGIIDGVKAIPEKFEKAMKSILSFAKDTVQWIVDAFDAMPKALEKIAEKAMELMKKKFHDGINSIRELLSKLPGITLEPLEEFVSKFNGMVFELPDFPSFEPFFQEGRFSLDQFKGEVTGAASEVGTIYADEFANALSRNFLGEAGNSVMAAFANLMQRAMANALNAASDRAMIARFGGSAGGDVATPVSVAGTGGAKTKTFAEEMAELQQKIELERQYGIQKAITNQILSIEKAIKRELSATEKDQVASAMQLLEVSKVYGSILEEIRGPQEALQFGQAALNQLFEEGAISLDHYNSKLRELQINADKAANTIGGGFRAAIAGAIQSAGQFGETLGNFIVGAAGRAADAIVEFAQTGKLNIRAFFADLFAQLLKLAAQRLLLSFLGGFLGIPGASLAGGGLGFATGGSILPSGPGSTDSQIVTFAKRPDERVDILTPGQQQAQKNGEDRNNGTTIVQSPPVNIVALLNPSDIINVFNDGGDAQIINILQRNSSTVKQIAQS